MGFQPCRTIVYEFAEEELHDAHDGGILNAGPTLVENFVEEMEYFRLEH